MRWLIILYILSIAKKIGGVQTIENGVFGTPLVECGETALAFNANTRKIFTGRVLVQGMTKYKNCTYDFSQSPTTNIQITIPIGMCKMQRTRMTNPTGMRYAITLIISFHPIFITEVDKAYRLHCSYVLSEKRLMQHFEVSTLSTQELSGTFAIPTCEYTVRKKSLKGPMAQYAVVGEPLYHVWKCVADDLRMLVRNCLIEDSGNGKFLAINEKGCSTDHRVIGELQYTNDFTQAHVEMHAFKFVDDVNVHIRCEIAFCHAGDQNCQRNLPPNCAIPNQMLHQNMSFDLKVLALRSGGGFRNLQKRKSPVIKDKIDHKNAGQKNQYKPWRSIDDFLILDISPQNRFYILDNEIQYHEGTLARDQPWPDRKLTDQSICDCQYMRWHFYTISVLCIICIFALVVKSIICS